MNTAAGKILLALVVTSLMSLRQLLILAGDVELNPGPLGQHGEGKVTIVTAVYFVWNTILSIVDVDKC